MTMETRSGSHFPPSRDGNAPDGAVLNPRPRLVVAKTTTPLLLSLLLFLTLSTLPPMILPGAMAAKVHTTNCPIDPPTSVNRPPLLVIGHRGASYHLPEHTLAGYRLALELGADYVEPDLVPTSDGHLVAVHSVDLNVTTDVEAVFPDRRRTDKLGPMKTSSGYVVSDFTLDEIRKLTVRQRVEDTPARSRMFDGMYKIPTLDEIIDLLDDWTRNVQPIIHRQTNETERRLRPRPGLYVELKSPSWLREDSGVEVSSLLIDTLRSHPASPELFFDADRCSSRKFDEYTVPPLVMQCFDPQTLDTLRDAFVSDNSTFHGVIPPSVLLISAKQCRDEEFWLNAQGTLSRYDGLGPDKTCLFEVGEGRGRDLTNTAIEHGLVVHPWTERLEVEFVNEKFDTAEEELTYLFCEMGIDGIFAENVGLAVKVAAVGCDDENDEGGHEGEEHDSAVAEGMAAKKASEKREKSTSTGGASAAEYPTSSCPAGHPVRDLLGGLALLVSGALVGAAVSWAAGRRRRRRNGGGPKMLVPDRAEDHHHDGAAEHPVIVHGRRDEEDENEII